MLAGTSIKPPQLDDFMLEIDSDARVADMTQLGWSEAELFA